MATKLDFDLIIAGAGVLPLALGKAAAAKKLDVLVIPPLEKPALSRDTFFLSEQDLQFLKGQGFSGAWENFRISDGGFHYRGRREADLPEDFRYVITSEVLERQWEGEGAGEKLKKEEGLDIRTCREEEGAVLLEGLSSTWSFRYNSRFLVVFPNHGALWELLDFPGQDENAAQGLCGDFENHEAWQDSFRADFSPRGLLQSWLVGKNTRRFLLPLDKPVEPFATDMLREVLPPLTGAALEEKRRVGEFLWTLPRKNTWIHQKGRILSLTPQVLTYQGLPGSNGVLSGLMALAGDLAAARRAPVKVVGLVAGRVQEENRKALKLRGAWNRLQSLQKVYPILPGFLRKMLLKKNLRKLKAGSFSIAVQEGKK